MSLIHQKLSSIAFKINGVSKNSTNKDEGWKFRSIYDIYNQLQPLFRLEKVFLYPRILESSETQVITNKGKAFRIKMKVEWTFSCGDGSSISSITMGEAIDSSDKASNKAMTASLKYLMIYMFLIPTVPYEVDADFNSPTIDPFEKIEEPKTILAMAEHKGISRSDLKEIAIKIGLNVESDLTPEQKKSLFDLLASKSTEDLKKLIDQT